MYELSREDQEILINYRSYLESEVSNSNDEDFKRIIKKSVELLSGEITAETLRNYLEVQVKNSKQSFEGLSESSMNKINDVRMSAKQYGVMDVVKRYKEGSK